MKNSIQQASAIRSDKLIPKTPPKEPLIPKPPVKPDPKNPTPTKPKVPLHD
jgi:hypothetical protein